MEKPYDIESLAWWLHEYPYVLLVPNGEKSRPLKYEGIHKNAIHFRVVSNGMLMKFEIEGCHARPIDYKEDHFLRVVPPNFRCRYFYTTEKHVKECEWDDILGSVL